MADKAVCNIEEIARYMKTQTGANSVTTLSIGRRLAFPKIYYRKNSYNIA